jgi:signal transduction histidine kinase
MGATAPAVDLDERGDALEKRGHPPEERSHALEERYHALLLKAPTPICVTRGPQHRIELVNPAYQIFSVGPEAVGQIFAEAHAALGAGERLAVMDRVYRMGERSAAVEATAQVRDAAGGGERHFNFLYEPLRDGGGTVDGLMILAVEVTAQVEGNRALEAVHRRSRFLVSASAALSESLDYERTLRRVAELAVPDIADWCTVSAIDERGAVKRLAIVHADPAKRDLVAEYAQKFPPTEHRAGQMVDVLEHATAVLMARVGDDDLVGAAQTEDHLRVLRGLGCTSCIIVPMVARGEILGAISLMRAEPSRPYGEADVAIAEELAHRAALAVDSARLYRQARRREETMRFFAEASVLLSSSLDFVSICERLAHLVVPTFADWCGVDLLQEGELRSIAITHVNPAKLEAAWEMRRRYPPDPAAAHGSFAVLRSGRGELVREIADEMLVHAARDAEHLGFIRELGLRSFMSVPLVAGGRTIGVLNLVWAESGHLYRREDLEVMEELGRRAGLAVENARLYDEARGAVKVRDEFLSIASHELKTPLTSLRLKVDGILRAAAKPERGPLDSAKLSARLAGVGKQLGRLTELVDALLDVSRAAAGRLELTLDEVDLAVVVREVAERFKDDLATAGCTLSIVLPAAPGAPGQASPVVGRWDRLRVDEIVTNFLSNAIKYGAGKPIEIRVAASETEAVVEVEDRGIGIALHDQPRLFERFARVASPDHYGGFGLGLWIVKILVEAMGGRVGVRSAVGVGSVFSVALPRAVAR